MDLVQGIHRFIDGLLATGRLAEQPSERRFVVTGTKPGGIGREIVGTITGGEADITGVIVTVGNGDVYHTGEEYEAAVTGGPANMKVRLGIRLNSQNPPRGANMFAALPAPIVSVVTNPDDGFDNPIGLYTEEDLNSATGANGEPFALLRLFYRLIVPGVYSVYKDFLQYVQVQVRPVAAENWRNVPSQVITPSRLLRIATAEHVTALETNIDVALPADVGAGDLFIGHYVHWRMEAEIMIAKLVTTLTGFALVVLARGADGSTAAEHPNGAGVELLTGMATVGGMEPGVETAVRAAFVDIHNVAGPPSVVNVLTTWKRLVIPALTAAQFHVDLQRNGWHLTWTRPTDAASGLPFTGRLMYRIWRQRLAAGLTTAGAQLAVDGTMNFSADIPVTDWPDPATRADAKLFGIQPYDSFGNLASTGGQNNDGILWAVDNVPSPNPSPNGWVLIPGDLTLLFQYDRATDDANAAADPGFAYFGVLRGYDSDLGPALSIVDRQIVATFGNPDMGSGAVTYTPPLDRAYYYQVVSVDLAGNVTPAVDDEMHWRIGLPNLFATPGVRNGNFQTPNPRKRSIVSAGWATSGSPTVTVYGGNFAAQDYGTLIVIGSVGPGGGTYYGLITGIVDTNTVTVAPNPSVTAGGQNVTIGDLPDKWRMPAGFPADGILPLATIPAGWTVSYESTGGIAGNRVMHIHVPAGNYTAGAHLILAQTIVQQYSKYHDGLAIEASIKVTGAAPAGFSLESFCHLFSDDFGQVEAGQPLGTNGTGATLDGAWHRVPFVVDDANMFGETGGTDPHSYLFGIGFLLADTIATPMDIYLDDVITAYYP